jgi:hypothetical protein
MAEALRPAHASFMEISTGDKPVLRIVPRISATAGPHRPSLRLNSWSAHRALSSRRAEPVLSASNLMSRFALAVSCVSKRC